MRRYSSGPTWSNPDGALCSRFSTAGPRKSRPISRTTQLAVLAPRRLTICSPKTGATGGRSAIISEARAACLATKPRPHTKWSSAPGALVPFSPTRQVVECKVAGVPIRPAVGGRSEFAGEELGAEARSVFLRGRSDDDLIHRDRVGL